MISVIIPVHNAEQFIAQTVQSVLDQTYQAFELLIVDDGSSDRSIKICQQFHDPRITILTQPNRGVSGARNTGIRHAQGEYIAFLDGDDLWLPEKLAKHVQHLDNAPHVGLSFSRSAFINHKGEPLEIYQMPSLKNIKPAQILCRNPVGNGSAPVIRREALQAIKYQDNFYGSLEDFYFDEQLHHLEDIECWLRIALTTQWQIEGIPEALTLYRVNLGGASTNLAGQLESHARMLNKTRAYAPELISRWGDAAKAYQIRFQARRMVKAQNGQAAVQLAHQALHTYWRLLLEEPRRTGLTLAAAYSLCLLPRSFYQQLENLALKITGNSQKRQILREGQQ